MLVWVLGEADAKMRLNMQGFNKGNACERSCVGAGVAGRGNEDLNLDRGNRKRLGGCILDCPAV